MADSRKKSSTERKKKTSAIASTAPNEVKEDDFPSPLASPILDAMFKNVKFAGKATRSLVNAVLVNAGEKKIRKVKAVAPQYYASASGDRTYRIDVVAVDMKGDTILLEVQLERFPTMNERLLLYSLTQLSLLPERGADLKKTLKKMSRVIGIALLNFVLRPSSKNFHQIGEFVYREEPREQMTNVVTVHQLQLPLFREYCEFDPNNPLHLWLEAIISSQEKGMSLKKVVEANGYLQNYYRADEGSPKFADR
ncbi:MAG: Rpn family recombination-promoting nuclease/putative transposase, partial [Deltaproteobacteria bacterium]|nr:Rpn family recombination-promoting nuclease/putative transposase [Deltaproteobacteria bacterium]